MRTLRMKLWIFVVILSATEAFFLRRTNIISTSSGPVQGLTLDFNDKEVDLFLGIPFAEPPIGQLRFRKPQPIKPWKEVRLFAEPGPACVQYEEYDYPWYDNRSKSEDCLYLNIWVPHSNGTDGGIPVLFWIYGGGFSDGSNKLPIFNGLALAAEGEVIVVTINYRLSTLGFLRSDTSTAPGNAGLYDVLEALKWVNKNIGAFGGDPNKLTLDGCGAGSIIIGYLCVSPLARGLFTRVILQSGSPAFLIADVNDCNILNSQQIADVLNCADGKNTIYDDPDKVVDCLRGKNAFDLVKSVNSYTSALSESFFPNYGDEILPNNPREALTSGQFQNVDVLAGNVYDEGSYILTSLKRTIRIFGGFGEKNPRINKTFGESLLKKFIKDIPEKADIIKYYLGNITEDDYDKIREKVYTAMGDFKFLCPTRYFADTYSQSGNNVFYYFFAHRPSYTPWAKWMKVVHYDDVPFVFGNPLLYPDYYTEAEKNLSLRIIRIWSNFVKYGSPECPQESEWPESNWPPYTKEKPVYVRLSATKKKGRKGYGRGPHEENCNFLRPYFAAMYLNYQC